MVAMRGWQLRPLPMVLFGLTLATELAAIVLSWGLESRYDTLLYAVYSVSLAGAGALIASRQPRNAIGWLFCTFALLNAVTADVAQGWSLRAAEEGWPGGDAAAVLAYASWQPSGLGWVLTFLLFPDGHLPSPRWRWPVAALVAAAIATSTAFALRPGPLGDEMPDNPIGLFGVPLVDGLVGLAGALEAIVIPLAVVLLVAMFTVHLPYGFSSIKLVAVTGAGPQFGPPGYEVALLYLASLAALVVGGSGPLSIDGLRMPRQQLGRRGD